VAIQNTTIDLNTIVQMGDAVFPADVQLRFQQMVNALKTAKAVDMTAIDCYLSEYELTDRLRLSVKDPDAALSAQLALNQTMPEIVQRVEDSPGDTTYETVYNTLLTLKGNRFDPMVRTTFESAGDGGTVYPFPRWPSEDPRATGRIVTVGPDGILKNVEVWKWILNNAFIYGFVPYDEEQRKALYFIGVDEIYQTVYSSINENEALKSIIGRYQRDTSYVDLVVNLESENNSRAKTVQKEMERVQKDKTPPLPTITTSGGANISGLDYVPPGHGALDNNKKPVDIVVISGTTVVRRTGEAFLIMQAAAKKEGIFLAVNSGFRPAYGPNFQGKTAKGKPITFYTQETLRRDKSRWRGRSNPKFTSDEDFIFHAGASAFFPATAPPGVSNHGNGEALDLNTGSRVSFNKKLNDNIYIWLCKNSWKYGFIRAVSTEEWHFEYWPDKAKKGPYALVKPQPGNDRLFYADLGLDKLTIV
jgi:hypothetical protein